LPGLDSRHFPGRTKKKEFSVWTTGCPGKDINPTAKKNV
jgi:hypothetical protein